MVGVGGLAWLTNTVDPDLGPVLAAMLVATGAMFVAALAVPDTFGAHGVLFGVAFLFVSVMHLTLYALAARGDPDLLAAILRIAPTALAGAGLIVVAGFVDGQVKPVLWLAALAIGYIAPLFGGARGWRVEPAHFIERHGLIMIIAIGESLIAIGLGERHSGLTIGVIVAVIPFVMIFDVGVVPGIIASVIYPFAAGVRVTALGIKQVPEVTVEAATTFGATDRQLLWGVRIPLALSAIMLAVNQLILMTIAMVIIVGLNGGGALGYKLVESFQRQLIGQGVEVALALTLMAMVLDRLTQALAARSQPPSAPA